MKEEQLRAAACALAARRGASGGRSLPLNQLINVAVAEKLSALRREKYFAEHTARASIPKALSTGVGNPPVKCDKRDFCVVLSEY